MFGYSEAKIQSRAAKRGQTVDEHLEYLTQHQSTRNERRREARKARATAAAAEKSQKA